VYPQKLNMKIFFIIIFASLFLISCQTVTNKIDEKTNQETKKLSKWLNETENELKINFGNPDKIEFTNNRTRYYIYIVEKLKIKCERKFEINQQNIIVGFSSKNCF
tara:strand:+ start:236 stop:553 length:318 start_codon:yes stop_codon:yes gene_type:complete